MNFSTVELIRRTRDGKQLSNEEIQYLVDGFSKSTIPDYQISAWLMAVYLKGLGVEETYVLTKLMRDSGAVIDWKKNPRYKNAHIVDKHSSGGIGDKVSLPLLALCASMGMKVPMMGGRGLGHTGGTIDKLDSIPGFRSELSVTEVERCFDEIGCYIIGQTKDICPADKKLYALRDVTGTIESLPLITASIVSKKWSEGLDSIVYDVKCGSAAFMETIEDARALAKSLVNVSNRGGMRARALITRMEEPLGALIGNSLEVLESQSILSGHYKSENHRRLCRPLATLVIELAAHMAVVSRLAPSLEVAKKLAQQKLDNGDALKTFALWLKTQGAVDGWESKLPKTSKQYTLASSQSGTIAKIHSRTLGLVGIDFGMGRKKTDDTLNFGVGFEMHVMPGDTVQKGDPLLTFYYDGNSMESDLSARLLAMFEMGSRATSENLTLEVIEN